MRFKILFFAAISLLLNDLLLPDNVFGFPQQEPQEEIRFNSDLGTFPDIPATIAGVDSLLAFGNEMRSQDSRLSFFAAKEALTFAKQLGYKEGEAQAHNLAGNKYLDFGDYEHSLTHYLLGFEIEEELGNYEGMASIKNNLALVHLEQENYNRAASYLQESMEIRESIGQTDQTHISINNIGVMHRRKGDYDLALGHFQEAAKLSLEVAQDSVMYMIATLNIGNTYRNKNELDIAIGYLERADYYFEREEFLFHQITTNLFLGQLYRDLGRNDEALEHGLRSLELAQQENNKERIANAHELVADVYRVQGDFQKALNHFEMFYQVSDTLLNLQRVNAVNEMQVQYEVEQKDREIALNEAQIAQQESWRNFMIVGLILLTLVIGLLYVNVRMKKKNNLLLEQRRKEIEKQNEELAALNNQKDEFISIVAHDLRNPISVIMTATTLLNSEEKLDKDNVDEYSELIQISTDRMLNLVNNMLDIQSVEQKSGDIKQEKVDVNESVKQSIHHFEKTANVKRISLITSLDEDVEMMLGDHSSLIRIFDNLISNSIKYSDKGKRVWISTEKIDDTIRVCVKDEGPGLTEEDQKKLFGRFTSLSSSPTGNESSTGLGLYIAKKLTESMSGQIWCKSVYGEGSVFIVEFSHVKREKDLSQKEKAVAK
ncbi:MAG: tetratricopeptide repeat-containing sensor histidine kinase [Balneolaceae bacterium]